MTDTTLHAALKRYFGFSDFRPGQLDAIRPVMNGRDALVVMPTGAGKSLCYQLPALLKTGTTLVISPLIALMKDQVDALTARGVEATFINSSLPTAEQTDRLDRLVQGAFRLVYIAPERLRNVAFRNALERVQVGLLAVDEAHCISQWGHDFRPDYVAIGEFLEEIGRPSVMALTATATPQVQEDIIRCLKLAHPIRLVTGFNRPNLRFEVRFTPGETRKQMELRAILEGLPSGAPGIIYVGRRREAEEVAEFVRTSCQRESVYYHGGMDARSRAHVQEAFMSGRRPVVVATNAFGMGIDKPDVRFVIHYTMPGTIEAYYQEAGRAGRDGAPSRCVILYDPADARLHEWFIENDAPTLHELRELYRHLRQLGGEVGAIIGGTSDQFAATLRLQGESKVRVGLKLLEEAGLLEDLGEWSGQGHWRLLPVSGRIDMQAYMREMERRRAQKRRQLAEMLDYCQTHTCRRQYLLDYFGDPTPPVAEDCCDNCSRVEIALPTRQPVTEADRRPLVIFQTVAELKWGVGRTLLAKILCGSRSAGMERYFEQANFGRLSHLRLSDVQNLIDALIRQGYLVIEGAFRPTLSLSELGWRALRENLAVQVDEPVAEARSPRMTAGETIEVTRALLAEGLSPEQIAEHRGLTVGTIYNHLAELIGQGRVRSDEVVAADVRAQIIRAWEAADRTSYLSPIKHALPDHISYGEIRCVLAELKRAGS